ncbi:MAG: T9SS type A sorting domain-containing protein [Bacteroidota bacterium]
MKKIKVLMVMIMGVISINTNAQNLVLWGTCCFGGTNGYGSIFQIDSSGNNFHIVYSFDSTNGFPHDNMIQANNGKIYGLGGTTYGIYERDYIYEYDPIANTATKVHDFNQDTTNGFITWSGMIKGLDGKLYGLCDSGGMYHNGVIYSFDPNTHNYTNLFSFNDTLGGHPQGRLLQLNNGMLYGMTFNGGAFGFGVIFSYDLTANNYMDIKNFDSTTGAKPYYSTLIQATDGKLYGMTELGGLFDGGVIFNYDVTSNIYTDIFDFDCSNSNGCRPLASLFQASNGKLYGFTYTGGGSLYGTIFIYDIITHTYTKRYDFDLTNGNGSNPTGSFVQAGNNLFATVQCTNLNYGLGVAIKLKLSTGVAYIIENFITDSCWLSAGDFLATTIDTGIPYINNNEGFNLFPNPFTSQTTLTLQGTYHHPSLFIYNLLGQEVQNIYAGSNKQIVINRNNLPGGMYFYKLMDDDKQVIGTGKMVMW